MYIRRGRPSFQFLIKFITLLVIFGCYIKLYRLAVTDLADAGPGSLNYFMDKSDMGKLKYAIYTSNCKLIEMSPWDNQILPFIIPKTKPPDCSNGQKNWIYVEGTTLIMNETAIKASGYSLNSIRCCFRTIIRPDPGYPESAPDSNVDNEVKYSEECYKIQGRTKISPPFIRVFCMSTSWPFLNEVIYRDFFAIANPRKSAKEKIKYWKQNRNGTLPPSVVMIGIDSISRMNYHRNFPATDAFLKSIGSVEMLGYTKVGENTLPNTVAFLAGLSFDDLSKTCLRQPNIPQDLCPYIWQRFDAAKYLTATVEDAPGLVGFNYMKLGFVHQPTDFYFRPFMLAVHKSLPRKDYYHTDCIGRYTTEETILNYIQGIMNHSSTAPVFIHSWMTSLAHLDINGAGYADGTIAKFLKSSDLSNTILIFLSDHGQRYGAIRETLPGWYEDKLPILSIYIPPSVQKKHPTWKTVLTQNSQRLTSPYDLYHTMNKIIDDYTNTLPPLEEEDKDGNPIRRIYGQSLLDEIPVKNSRSCKDVGVAVNYCACLPPNKLNSTDPLVIAAAEVAVAYLNQNVPSQCAQANLDRVVAGALMESTASDNDDIYVVSFYTTPGDFMFEANVNYDNMDGKFSVSTDLLRMNKIVRDASCVNTSLLERYCFCK